MQAKRLAVFILVLLLVQIVHAKVYDIFPTPQTLILGTESFPLESFSFMWKVDADLKDKFQFSIVESEDAPRKISVTIGETVELSHYGNEAYLIEVTDEGGRIVASSERALYYALITFKQLIKDAVELPEVTIIDAPDYQIRGVIEGFYHDPWSHAARVDMVRFLGESKMNTYVYAPKDDPYHREKWREPYPDEKLAQLKELVQAAKASYVDFVFAISPGLSIEFSSESDWQKLLAKTDAMIEIGITHFALLLDDIDPNLRSARDRAKYGNDYALAQVDLCNRYQDYLAAKIPGHRLIVVPTEYYQEGTSPYRRTYNTKLSPDIIVYSTGYGIVAQTITPKEAREIYEIWGHDIVYWDNYPVNDYNRTKLFMAPIAGRGPTLPGTLGFTFNPMNEAELSKLPLLTCADYTWNSASYVPEHSWERAVAILGGEHQDTYRRFAEQNLVFFPDGPQQEYPTLTNLAQEFLTAHKAYAEARKSSADAPIVDELKDDTLAKLKALQDEFRALEGLRGEFEEYFPLAAKEAAPYLKRLENWGKVGAYYTDTLLKILEAGPLSSSTVTPEMLSTYSTALETYLKGLALNRFDVLSSSQIGSSTVVLPILDSLGRVFASNFTAETIVASTNMPVWQNYVPANAVDSDTGTFFWSSRGQRPGDFFMVDLGSVQTLSGISLLMGNSNLDYFHKCIVEISADGTLWEAVATLEGTPDHIIQFFEPKTARYLKVTGLVEKEYWIIIRQFEPIYTEKKTAFGYDRTMVDVFNKIAVDPLFVIESEITVSLEVPVPIETAGIIQDPSLPTTWTLSYSLDGETFIEGAVLDSLVQVLPLPPDPIKALRFTPHEEGTYLRSIFVVPKN